MQRPAGLEIRREAEVEDSTIQQERRALLLLRRVEFELSAAGLRHRGTDNRNGLDPLPVVDRRKSRTRKRSLRQINRVEAKLPPVIVVPAHDVHRCLGIVDRRSAEDAVLRKVCVPAIEAELLWLRLAEPLRPDERVSRLRQCRFLVGVVRVDGVVHRRQNHRVESACPVDV